MGGGGGRSRWLMLVQAYMPTSAPVSASVAAVRVTPSNTQARRRSSKSGLLMVVVGTEMKRMMMMLGRVKMPGRIVGPYYYYYYYVPYLALLTVSWSYPSQLSMKSARFPVSRKPISSMIRLTGGEPQGGPLSDTAPTSQPTG